MEKLADRSTQSRKTKAAAKEPAKTATSMKSYARTELQSDSVASIRFNTEPVSQRIARGGAKNERAKLKIERHFTKPAHEAGIDVFAAFDYTTATSKIKDTDGKTVFEMKDVEVPAAWSQLAIDILVSKYFRKAGVPQTNHEVSVKQVVRRIARTIRTYGEANGYFDAQSAQTFEDELSFLLLSQRGAFNSPVWFNLGLYHEY